MPSFWALEGILIAEGCALSYGRLMEFTYLSGDLKITKLVFGIDLTINFKIVAPREDEKGIKIFISNSRFSIVEFISCISVTPC